MTHLPKCSQVLWKVDVLENVLNSLWIYFKKTKQQQGMKELLEFFLSWISKKTFWFFRTFYSTLDLVHELPSSLLPCIAMLLVAY